MTPTMIAIVPTEKYREALLGDGPCGSRAPIVSSEEVTIGRDPLNINRAPVPWHVFRRYDGSVYPGRLALPLLWRGQPVPDGIARAVRALGVDACDGHISSLVFWEPEPWEAKDIADRCLAMGIAAEVIIEPKETP